MTKTMISVLLTAISLVACVAADPDNYNAIQVDAGEGPSGKVLFYRGNNLQASLADAYLGTEQGYFLRLDQQQYSTLEVPAGFHEFKVRAQGSVAYSREIKVNADETVCIETRPNFEELEWLVVPFVNALIPSFVIEETACPGEAMLGELASV